MRRSSPIHIAAEGGVGGVQGEYLLLAAFEFQPGRQHRLDDLFPEGPRFPAAAQADRLHRKRAGAAGHPSRSEVLPHGAAERQRIDPEMAVETFVLVSSNSDTEFVRHAVRREKAPLSVGSDLGRHQTAVAASFCRGEKARRKSVRGRHKHTHRSRGKERQQQEIYCFSAWAFPVIFYVSLTKLPKTTMKAIRYVLFATALLLFRLMRQAAVRYHRIVAERSDGRQNADSRDVQGERRAEGGQNPGSRIDLALRRFRRLPFGNADAADHPPVAPEIRHPLQGDHRRRETHRTAAQRRRGIRIRHAETAVRLQRLLAAAKRRHDLLRTGRRSGLVRLRGERLRGEEPQDKRTEESGRRVGALRERHHAPVYRRQHRPRRGSGLHADARFRLRRQQDPDRRSAQKDEYGVLDHSVARNRSRWW